MIVGLSPRRDVAVLSGEAPLTLRGDMTLSSGRKADVRRSLGRDRGWRRQGPGAPREAFEPGKAGIAPPMTARQNSLLAALKAKRLEVAESPKATRLRHFP